MQQKIEEQSARYETISALSEKEDGATYLVRDKQNGELRVKKQMERERASVYLALSAQPRPGVPRIYDVFSQGGVFTVIEEFIKGESLERKIERCGLPPARTAVNILVQICDILSVLHAQNIIHRDINPSNIMISPQGAVTLIDFDIARIYKPSQTQDTAVLGTVGYAAPEQFGFLQTDARADIYALGVLLGVLLTGALPKERKAAKPFCEIIGRCIEIDPKLRYQSVSELKRDLTAGRASPPPDKPPVKKRTRLRRVLLACTYVILGVSLISEFVELAVGSGPPVELWGNIYIMILAFLLPITLLADVGGITDRLFFLGSTRKKRRSFVIAIGIVSIAVGLALLYTLQYFYPSS